MPPSAPPRATPAGGAPDSRESVAPPAPRDYAVSPAPVAPVAPPPPPLSKPSLPPTQPLSAEASAARRPAWISAIDGLRARIASGEWKPMLRAEVNAPYFWGVVAAAGLFLAVILAAGWLRYRLVSSPTAPVDPEVVRDVAERRKALVEGKKLFAEGKYDRSLALFRQVLARSPGNQEARRFVQMAETQLAGRAEEARKSAEADKSLDAARTALAEGRYADAVQRADETLALDGGKVEAQKIKEEAQTRLAEAKAAETKQAEALARKKKEDEKKAKSTRRVPTPLPQKVAEGPPAPPTAAPAAAAGPATLRLLFQSPISEGSVMVYVNDQKALQKPFDFSKKSGLFKRVEGTGTLDEAISVKPGPVNVKVWLSGKGLNAAAYTTAAGQLAGGETRVLKVEYTGGQLSAHIQ